MRTDINILAVDDFPSNLKDMKDILKDVGELDFYEARNGREALTILADVPDIDVILLDLEMPIMNGYETLGQIKCNDRFRDIPVNIVTSDKSEIRKTLAMGANDFLARPYDPEELKLRVSG